MDLQMGSRPGASGRLNKAILERVQFLAKELDIPHLMERFTHLLAPTGGRRPASSESDIELSSFIDHTVLKADSTIGDVKRLCQEAKDHHFFAVCVHGCRVPLCKELLKGTSVRIASVCGFPLGQMSTAAKVAEAREVIEQGAHEVDVVLNVGDVKEKKFVSVYNDIRDVCSLQATSKVILETCLLTDEEIIDCCIISVAAGASFVKTSTGFSTGGATPEAVDIMLAVVGDQALVKVSGGVRDSATALQYINAGVRRIGTSSGIAIACTTESSSGY